MSLENNKEKKIRLLCTGGCGFVGHHLVEHFIKETDWEIIIFDKLNYASSGYDRLRDIKCFDEKRVRIFPIDLNQSISEGVAKEVGNIDYIINLASESHVDNSISNPVPFIRNNVNLMLNMLEWARTLNLKKFIQFSTDEVYGTAENESYKEGSRHNPGNPYSASKACQEDICRAYSNCYGIPIIITNGMNIVGERQHPEKFVPMVIKKVLAGEKVIIHSNKDRTRAGTRFYIHARNVAKAIHFLLDTPELLDKVDASKGQHNIVGEKEIDNLTLARFIANVAGKPLIYEMVDFHSSRPGHDLRYALDGTKLRNMGFEYPKTLEQSLEKTIRWFIEHQQWLIP